ncbi:MAG TPA: hypothetical protein PLA03_03370 [Acidobacteriota bacterium]|nr:hypothetical protein [Acidobacteriota bacterium]
MMGLDVTRDPSDPISLYIANPSAVLKSTDIADLVTSNDIEGVLALIGCGTSTCPAIGDSLRHEVEILLPQVKVYGTKRCNFQKNGIWKLEEGEF